MLSIQATKNKVDINSRLQPFIREWHSQLKLEKQQHITLGQRRPQRTLKSLCFKLCGNLRALKGQAFNPLWKQLFSVSGAWLFPEGSSQVPIQCDQHLQWGLTASQTWRFTPHPSGQQLTKKMTLIAVSELCIDNMSQEIKAVLHPHLHDYLTCFSQGIISCEDKRPPLVSKAWHWHRHHLHSWAGKEARSVIIIPTQRLPFPGSRIETVSTIACSHVYCFSWTSWQRDTDKWLQRCSLNKGNVETHPKRVLMG